MQTSFSSIADDALSTARLVPRWHLAPEQWPAVQDALAQLLAALASGRAGAVRKALIALEDLGPVRLAAITSGSEAEMARAEPPPLIRELVNQLVHPPRSWTERSANPGGEEGRA